MERSKIAAVAAPLLLILAACSSGGGASTAPTTAASQPPASVAPTSSAPDSSAETGDEYELKVAAGSGDVANFLTGEDGKTLYIFTKDTKGSGKSVCNGDCATNWPPLLVDNLDEVKPDSAATGTLALITRDDGKKQLSYNGMPLYYFAADKAAGDTNGQGVGGVWFVAKA